ncbi:ornithine carbamoyltransferase [Paraburkholderia sp. JPY158]|uniref:Ornithine carbamoyltransferase n=1 Tax=Paraburkholderia atlantica TaxID=2654982 RepID=A0A7W8QEQ0_PARAM|nr:ornithine carbamoyltransferase [Paraburkholderia atlantica]
MKDTARVLGRMYDAIEYSGFSQEIVEELARFEGVPVFNGLTDEYHPTQMLADVLTMREHSDKPLRQISYAYLGDARNNMGTRSCSWAPSSAWTCALTLEKRDWAI